MKKKIFAGILVASMMLGGTAYAAEQDLGVVALTPVGEEDAAESVTLEDLKVGDFVEIEGFGDLTALLFEFKDEFYMKSDGWKRTGDQADFAILKIKMLNTNTSAKRYLNDFEVKMIYDDKYEYQGWALQCEGDDEDYYAMRVSEDTGTIDPLYVGYYMFGCTVPNAVVEGKAPLRMEINFDGNEITYNVRK
ncbi:hypothetical protein D7Y05_01440 [bacterium 1XD42-54]|nr:hypothetical protein D7Y05_01440 [bacterium 1XD42-54]